MRFLFFISKNLAFFKKNEPCQQSCKPFFTPLYAQLSEVRGTMSARAFSLGKQLIRAAIALFPSYCRPVRVEPIHGFFRQSLSIATQRQ